MNLAKKGTVLLAALSVFAMTSCGGGGEKEISIEEATKWINEHHIAADRKVKEQNIGWDYSGNVPSQETFMEYDINGFVAFALQKSFGVSEEGSKINKSSEIVKKSDDDFIKSWDEAKALSRFQGDDEEPKIYTSGNKLHIVSTNNSQTVTVGDVTIIIDAKTVEDYYFDGSMYLEKYVYKMTDDVCHVHLKGAEGNNLGKLDFTVTNTPTLAQ